VTSTENALQRRIVTEETTMHRALLDDLWVLFKETFAPLNTRAAARHGLTRKEFDVELGDERMRVWVARDRADKAIGFAAMTPAVELVEWISPAFYRARAHGRPVFYGALLAIQGAHQTSGLFAELMDVMLVEVHAAGGIFAYDLCGFNAERLGLASRVIGRASKLGPAIQEEVDTQRYFCVSFDDEEEVNP
jgi:hypothetical protein